MPTATTRRLLPFPETAGSSRIRRPWKDLLSELLGLVLSRLPSHADRARLPAVCRPWRSGARLQQPLLPPLLPWLALPDGTFLSLPDGAVHRVPLAGDVSGRFPTGSTLFLVHGDGRCSLMNPFPAAAETTPLPELADWIARKPCLVRKALVSSDHLAAVLVEFHGTPKKLVFPARGPQGAISSTMVEWAPPQGSFVIDIALFQGKIYIQTTTGAQQYQHELHVLDDAGGQQTTTPVQCIRSIPEKDHGHEEAEDESFDPYATDYYVSRYYLVASGHRLLMVERMIDVPPLMPEDSGIQKRTGEFQVFEAADLGSGCGRWMKVDTLMGHALFVSERCSESLPAGDGQCGSGVRQDCIYFVNEEEDMFPRNHENPFLDSGVYDMRDRTVTPLLPETAATPAAGDGPWPPAWFFPKT